MSELSLSERIKKDFDEFCDSQDDFCNGCPYISHGMCEIDYTVDYVCTKVRVDSVKAFAEWLSNTEYVASQGHFILPLRGSYSVDEVLDMWEKEQKNEQIC